MFFVVRARRRLHVGWLVAGWLAVALGCSSSSPELPRFEPAARPNVLIVLVDVLRRDHLGAYGYPLPTSPNIDAFAAESFRFDQAFSHSTWTMPSVATLFTSTYPDQHGLGRKDFEDDGGLHSKALPRSLETLAEIFYANGYRTVSVGANLYIQGKTGFAQGFEHFSLMRAAKAPQLTSRLLDRLDATAEDGRPFFAYLHYMDVHWPYVQSLAGDARSFGPDTFVVPPPNKGEAIDSWTAEHLDKDALAVLTARYDREIAVVDDAFGFLLRQLEERDVLDNTVVLFIADHGEGFYEHGRLLHGFEPYPEVTAVPVLLRLPPVYAVEPDSSARGVGLVDLLPTLLELVGIEVPAQAQGRSLVPLLLGLRLGERPIYMDGEGVRALRGSRRTVMVDRQGTMRCFDREGDPMELAPLAQPGEDCRRLAEAIAVLARRWEGQAGEPGTTVEFEGDEIEELRALGYLE